MNFILVGHTHDDIVALFRRWSMLLRKDKFPTIPLWTESLKEVKSIPAIPLFFEDVLDFKGLLLDVLLKEMRY